MTDRPPSSTSRRGPSSKAPPRRFSASLHDPPVPPSRRLGQSLPASLESLLLAALGKSPDQRPATMAAFEAALAACPVPPWTDADAETWWRSRRGPILAARTPATGQSPSSQERTLRIATDGRPGAGELAADEPMA